MAEKAGGRAQCLRCAIYTRKSSDEGLEQEFNSLHAQREACEAFIASQRHEGWHALAAHYDDVWAFRRDDGPPCPAAASRRYRRRQH
jgi:site-specific DNA recombinase